MSTFESNWPAPLRIKKAALRLDPGRKIINRQALGICMGASTVSFVSVVVNPDNSLNIIRRESILHDGNPKSVLLDKLAGLAGDKLAIVISGRKFRNLLRLTGISESEATEYAYSLYHSKDQPYSAIASLGAETFVVYELDKEGRIRKLISKNQCASGTGEFFMQQIGRMGLSVDEAASLSMDSEPFRVSGRCSVFCKSDCTHALNKGVPKDQVASGLARMISEKSEDLLNKVEDKNFLIVGGVSNNQSVIKFLKKKYPLLHVPPEASNFEALGAALYGIYHTTESFTSMTEVFQEMESQFTFHRPLKEFANRVIFSETGEKPTIIPGEACILGLDVGSTTTKGVLIRKADSKILASEYIYTHGNPVHAAKKVYESLYDQVGEAARVIAVGMTGSGRHITALHAGTQNIVNEISAHAQASVFYDPDVDTIFEIGGQDAKYTYIVNGVPADYAMNEACSAGTGSFIQEAAFESMRVKLEDIEGIAMLSSQPLNFRDQCAALIGSDIKSALQENFSQEDVMAGLVYSICLNYMNRVKGKRPVGKKIFMQGGVCYNKAIPIAMAALTGTQIVVPPQPGLMGAFGTALKLKSDLDAATITQGDFNLKDLVNRDFQSGKTFICNDKQTGCDRKCEINTFRIGGKIMPFGGACNKYYDAFSAQEIHWQKNDYAAMRMKVIFREPELELPASAKRVGLNLTFTINRLYPLYQAFFNKLGFRIILPDKVDDEGMEKQQSSFCYPVELSHGFFHNLLSQHPDYIFMPEVYEMHVPGRENDPKDSNATCVFISKEANYLSQTFKGEDLKNKLLHPYLNFAKGYASERKTFLQVGKNIGIESKDLINKAFDYAIQKQEEADQELLRMGDDVLFMLKNNPEKIAIVLVGRDYNAFSEWANKGIPQKIASLGFPVIPYDLIDSHEEEIISFQSWEAGKRILRAAQTIKKHPGLFPVYITNYSCGPDSILVPIFRSILGDKPSLTLELDQHTADAGINTRIDAFLDVVNNYKKSAGDRRTVKPSSFLPAEIQSRGIDSSYRDSDGQLVDLKSKDVTIVVPCIGDMVAALFAASLRSLGYQAVALPEIEPRVHATGLKYTSGKECLPLVLLAGSLMDYVENTRKRDEKIAFFNIGGTSACRVAQYPVFLAELVKSHEIRNVAMLTLVSQEGYLGLSKGFLKHSIEAIIINDVLEDVRSGILANAQDPDKGLAFFYAQFEKLTETFSTDYKKLFKALENFSRQIAENVPYRSPVTESKFIALTGEIFVRHNQYAHKKLNHYFGRKGYILKDAYISEWIKYLDYAWRKGVDRPEFSFRDTINRLLREQYIAYVENRVQKILAHTGYILPHKTNIVELIKHSLHVLPLESTGEPALTLGTALSQGYEHYCGIINIGPFGCLQTRIGEAISVPNMKLGHKKDVRDKLGMCYEIPGELSENTEIPFLTIECDGMGFPQIIESRLETFVLQAERVAENMKVSGIQK